LTIYGPVSLPEDQLNQLRKKFPKLLKMVRENYQKKKIFGRGHDLLHALLTAQYGIMIADDEHIGELVWIAGICHITDRLFPEEEVQKQLLYYLNEGTSLPPESKSQIITAVKRHSKPNDPSDDLLTVTLKDADRLANLGPNLFIRAAQFYNGLLAFDPRYVLEPDPTATYQTPKTVLHDIRCALEWDTDPRFCLRLLKARKYATRYFSWIKDSIELLGEQLEETGLLPFPAEFEGYFDAAYREQQS